MCSGTDSSGSLGCVRTLSTAVVATALGMVVLCLGKELLLTLSGVLILGIGMSLQVVVVTTMLSVRHGRMRGAALSEVNSIASGVGALTPLLIGVSVGAGFTWRLGYGVWPVAAALIFLCLSRIKAIPDAAFVLAPPDRSRLPRRFWIFGWFSCALSQSNSALRFGPPHS